MSRAVPLEAKIQMKSSDVENVHFIVFRQPVRRTILGAVNCSKELEGTLSVAKVQFGMAAQ